MRMPEMVDDATATDPLVQTPMKFSIEKNEALDAGLRRLLNEQLGLARRATSHTTDLPHSIHAARKAVKKARAVLKLITDGDADPFFKDEDHRLRDAARMLGPVRDEHVQMIALKKLSSCGEVDVYHSLEQRLRKQQRDKIAKNRTVSERFIDIIKLVEAEAARWPADPFDTDTVAIALRKSYRRARRCFKKVREAPTGKKLHDWRKATKDLRHQLRIIDKITNHEFRKLRKNTDHLNVCLGDDHDLFLLLQLLTNETDSESRIVKRELRKSRHKLQKRALKVGAKTFDLATTKFHKRLSRGLNRPRTL
jgi:CHAD domain-containing protein